MTLSLQERVTRIAAKGKLGFGDARRLFRDALPAGIETREEAELVAALDRAVSCVDPTWSEWLVPAFVYFVLSGRSPRNALDDETAHWLKQVLVADGEPTRRGAEILREVQRATGHDEADSMTSALVPKQRLRSRRASSVPDIGSNI